MAVADLNYWNKTRGIAKSRLGLGLPFYGYGFGTNAPPDMSFKKIIGQFPGAEKTDSVTVAGGGIIYYNGTATIRAKTALALQNAAGIMIWQLLQDAPDDNSLLDIIDAAVEPKKL
jgi:GH18 family chitinase